MQLLLNQHYQIIAFMWWTTVNMMVQDMQLEKHTKIKIAHY